MTTPNQPRRATPVSEIPVLDVDKIGRAPWEPRTKPDGTRDPDLPFWTVFRKGLLDAFRRRLRGRKNEER